jgi:hypothetical protein
MKTQLFIMSATTAENLGSTILGIIVIIFFCAVIWLFAWKVKSSLFKEQGSLIDQFLSKIFIFDTVSNKEINDFSLFTSNVSIEVFESVKEIGPPYLDILNQILPIIQERGDVTAGETTMDNTNAAFNLLDVVDRQSKIDKAEKEIKRLIQRMVIEGFFKKLFDFDSSVPHIYVFAEIMAASEIDVLPALPHPDPKIQEIFSQILPIIQERGDITSSLPMNDESQLAQRTELIKITTKKIGNVIVPHQQIN